MRWLTLLTTLPPTPTRHRVGVWRKLQRMGAVRLRGAAWILPETPETTELFQWLVQEIQSIRGEATLLRVDRIETMTDQEIAALFHKARAPEYQAVIRGCREILRPRSVPGEPPPIGAAAPRQARWPQARVGPGAGHRLSESAASRACTHAV